MVKDKKASSERYVYQAPALFVGIFYLLLFAWVLFCFLFFESTFSRLGFSLPYGLIMIAFIVFMMCYFSLGISYKIEVGNDGQIRLTSYRRIINTNAEDIQMIEGPHLPLGFIKFRLEREKAYLFSVVTDEGLRNILSSLKRTNRDMILTRL